MLTDSANASREYRSIPADNTRTLTSLFQIQ